MNSRVVYILYLKVDMDHRFSTGREESTLPQSVPVHLSTLKMEVGHHYSGGGLGVDRFDFTYVKGFKNTNTDTQPVTIKKEPKIIGKEEKDNLKIENSGMNVRQKNH